MKDDTVNPETPASTQKRLVEALCRPGCLEDAAMESIETHISWILLGNETVFKIKKPLDLGFLDYSTLERRERFCHEELRLNRRTAPTLYQRVRAIGGSVEEPVPDASPAIEYAVQMHRFDQRDLWDRMLSEGRLEPTHIDRLANTLAAFHHGLPSVTPEQPYGTPDAVYQPMVENFRQIADGLGDHPLRNKLSRQEQWCTRQFEGLSSLIARRKDGGFVRECHGDLHLGNIAMVANTPTPFDGIEFNPNLRWIDVISELAFLLMDLEDRGRPDFAVRLCNRYMERSGDYDGLALLNLYQHYRAMVRAKVTLIRYNQEGLDETERRRQWQVFNDYLNLATGYSAKRTGHLIITHGVSGSGKSCHTDALLQHRPAIRLRSDVERKRLFGLAAQANSDSAPGAGIYTAGASERTYGHLRDTAATLLKSGFTVIVDATFLKREQRGAFQQLAEDQRVPFTILAFQAPTNILRQRVESRSIQGTDPSEANVTVLERQLNTLEPLTDAEQGLCVTVDSTQQPDGATLAHRLPTPG